MNPAHSQLWNLVLDHLRQTCHPGQFQTWFSQTRLIQATSESAPSDTVSADAPEQTVVRLQIGCPSPYVAKWLTDNYQQVVDDLGTAIGGEPVEVTFVVATEPARLKPPAWVARPATPMATVPQTPVPGVSAEPPKPSSSPTLDSAFLRSNTPPLEPLTADDLRDQPSDLSLPAADSAERDVPDAIRLTSDELAVANAAEVAGPIVSHQGAPASEGVSPTAIPPVAAVPAGPVYAAPPTPPPAEKQAAWSRGPQGTGEDVNANRRITRRLVAPSGDVWESVPLSPHFTFDQFIEGPSNRLPKAAALAVAEKPGQTYNPLFLHGQVGLGKSHLLQAIAHALLAQNPNCRLLYITCETFVTQFIRALETHRLEAFQEIYRGLDVLIIDDIQFLQGKERTQDEFFHTFNALYNAQRQIVLSSDRPPEKIATLQDRLVSRFKMGLPAVIEPPSFETRVAIFRRKAHILGLTISDEVYHFLAERITKNVREMEGAIHTIAVYRELEGTEPTLDDVQRLLADRVGRAAVADDTPITMDSIVKAVVAFFNAKLTDLQSKRRTKLVTLPRQVCMYLAKRYTPATYEEIGGFFGGRDHSTVIYAVDKIERLRNEDPQTARTLETLETQLLGESRQPQTA